MEKIKIFDNLNLAKDKEILKIINFFNKKKNGKNKNI